MSERAAALAERFERANDEVIAAVAACTEEMWWSACPDDGRIVAVVARHIASGYRGIAAWLSAAEAGGPLPAPFTDSFAQPGRGQAICNCAIAETVALLRGNGAAVASLLRRWSDEQLDRPMTNGASGRASRAEHLIGCILFAHVGENLAALRRALHAESAWAVAA